MITVSVSAGQVYWIGLFAENELGTHYGYGGGLTEKDLLAPVPVEVDVEDSLFVCGYAL